MRSSDSPTQPSCRRCSLLCLEFQELGSVVEEASLTLSALKDRMQALGPLVSGAPFSGGDAEHMEWWFHAVVSLPKEQAPGLSNHLSVNAEAPPVHWR